MTPFQETLLLVVAGCAILLFFARHKIQEVLENFNRPGGPPTPMHPSPAGDDFLLRPNSHKKKIARI